MTDLRSKSLSYFRDSRLVILHARTLADARQPCEVVAVIDGSPAHSEPRRVQLVDGVWSCDCKAVMDDGMPCAHVAAVQLATNHPSLAAKPAKAQRKAA